MLWKLGTFINKINATEQIKNIGAFSVDGCFCLNILAINKPAG